MPARLEEHFAELSDRAGLDLHPDRHDRRRRQHGQQRARASWSARRCRCRPTATTYTLYFLFPLDEEQETLALVTRALLTAGGLLRGPGRRAHLAGDPPGRDPGPAGPPGRRAARRRPAPGAAAGHGEDDLARLATSFNQMATSLQRQIRQLEELSRVQRRFVSDVSHELRTPLTTVRMAGDVLHDARDDFDPATARAAELLQTELDRFETLLADLLEISRFDAGAAVLELDDVNLVDVAHRVVEATRPLAEQRDVRIVVRAPDQPCLAEADVRRVERIVRNLVTNAIDHARRHRTADGPTGDRRRSSCWSPPTSRPRRSPSATTASGWRPGESAMVFNRFWRADPARARTSGGTGLGLSISLEDAHLHGGWLQAWGQPGEGAQFRLTLPRRAGDVLRQSPLPLVPADAPEPVA